MKLVDASLNPSCCTRGALVDFFFRDLLNLPSFRTPAVVRG
jgi:hypothetical protein